MVQRILAMIAVVSLLVACGAPQSAAPAAVAPAATAATVDGGTLKTIRTGYIPVVIFAPLFVGIERGYFQDEGLQIELTPIRSGNDAVVQLAADNFDVALGGANAGLFNAAQRGVPFTIVAPLHSEKAPVATPLIVSPKRATEFTSVADLKGKKVAVNAIGAGTEYWLAQALAKGGLTMNDIELVALPFPEIPAALENGSLDAAVVTEPIVTISQDKGLVQVLSNDFIDGFTATYVYMGAILQEDPAAAQAFMRAYLRACRDLQGDYITDEVAAIIEKYTKVPAAVLKRIPKPIFNPNGEIPVQDLQALQTYFRGRGLLNYSDDLDVTTFVNQTIAQEAAAALDARK